MKHTQAFMNGVRSYWNYESIEDNPYDNEKRESVEWEDGYTTARAFDNGDIKDEAEYMGLLELMKSE